LRAAPSPSLTSTTSNTRMKCLGAFCKAMPALWSKNTNEAADPSKMGTSSAVMSTNKLSSPKPAQADIRCSTVNTLAPKCEMVEAKRVSVTAVAETGMVTGCGKSVRRNTMPVSGGAGRKVSSTFCPLCKPTPTAVVMVLSVRCCSTV